MRLQFIPSSYGPLKVWVPPQPGREYVIGVDTAEGKVRDRATTGRHIDTALSARDYSCAMVIDKLNASLCASWHGNLDTHKYSIVVFNLAQWYNQALLAIEVTGPGRAVQDNVSAWEYGNSWTVRKPQFADPSPGENVEFGWKTNAVTRPLIIRSIHEILGVDPDIPDLELLQEMKTMERDDQGKERGIGKHKDDRVFAYGIALRVRAEDLEMNAPEAKDERYKNLPSGDRYVWKQMDEEMEQFDQGKIKDVEEMDYVE